MALLPSLDPGPHSEPLNHPPGASKELDMAGCTICPASEEERIRPEQAHMLGQDSLDCLRRFQGGLGDTDAGLPAGHPRLPTPSSHEDSTGGKHQESPSSGWEVLEAEQDNLHLCLFSLGLRLRDLERELGPWTSAQNGMVQLQTLQADLRGAAERVDALLAFSEGLAQGSEPQARAPVQQVLRALRAHRDSIFWRLWQLQAQLVSYSLVFEEASLLDQDLEVEADSDRPGPGGVWRPWAPSSLPTAVELEWDPTGDVGGFRPLGQKTAWKPGAPCELCGHRGPQSRRQGLEDILMLGLSHRKHVAGHQRCSLLQKSQDKRRRASSSLRDVTLEVDSGTPTPASGQPRTFLFLLLILFLLLVGSTLLLPQAEGPCCSPARLAGTPYLMLSYVNGLPPI